MILVEDLHKSYNGNKAVDGISFAVKRGEVYAFLGENGAGKSTTINIICTILQKDKGKVTINGSELDKNDDKIKEDIGVVFQGSFLDKKLTVYENLATRGALYGFNKGKIKQRIASVTKRLDLESFLKQSYGTLSGGQRRRVDIARAILHRPKLLILDEPTTGLDPATRARVWDTIKQLQQQADLTVFFSTHYMEEAEYANTISIIKKGKLVATDTPYMLKQNYSYDSLHLYGRTKDIIKYLDKHQHQYIINNDFVAVKLKQSLESIDIINDLKGYLQSFEVQKGNMDTVFLTITGENDWQGEVSK